MRDCRDGSIPPDVLVELYVTIGEEAASFFVVVVAQGAQQGRATQGMRAEQPGSDAACAGGSGRGPGHVLVLPGCPLQR